MGFIECCSTFLTLLPDPALPFLPALLLGTIFASLILLYLYKKETNLPLNEILLHMVRNLFLNFPSSKCSSSHSETSWCSNPECVRCQKHGELRQEIGKRWRRWKSRAVLETLERVEQAVRRLGEKDKLKGSEQKIGGIKNDMEVKKTGESEGNLKYRGKLRQEENQSGFLDKHKAQRDEDKFTSSDKKEEKLNNGKNQVCEGNEGEKQNTQMYYQNPTLFHMDLPVHSSWNDYDVYTNEQNLLKHNFKLIMKEFEEVFTKFQSGDVTGWKNNNIPQGHWCIFPFVDQGKIIPSNCRRCPGVAEIILGYLPSMMNDCVFGNAAFSILYPDSYISPHHGPTNLRLRCHLGLKVPPGCWLEVAGQQYRWNVGETLLFDDSFTHSAHFTNQPSNVHSEPRAVLLLDFWHPNVSAQEKECLLELLSPLEESRSKKNDI